MLTWLWTQNSTQLRRAFLLFNLLLAVPNHTMPDASGSPDPSGHPEKSSLSRLTAQGFEIKSLGKLP